MPVSSLAVNVSSGQDLSLAHTLSTSVTITNPVGGKKGQKILFRLTQGGGGSNLVTWGSAYDFTAGLAAPILKTDAGQLDVLGFMYNSNTGKWAYVARGDHAGSLLPSQSWKAATPVYLGTAGRSPRGRH